MYQLTKNMYNYPQSSEVSLRCAMYRKFYLFLSRPDTLIKFHSPPHCLCRCNMSVLSLFLSSSSTLEELSKLKLDAVMALKNKIRDRSLLIAVSQ